MNNTYFTPVNPPRPLTEEERSLLMMLLSRNFDGVDQLRTQAKHVLVSGEFTDRSGSVVLAVDPSVPERYTGQWTAPVLARASDIDGLPIQVTLIVVNGRLAELEIHKYGPEPIKMMPSLDAFEVSTNEEVWESEARS
jgi:hypothetical protein